MYYPCSEDDGTPIKRCGETFPLYVYCDYNLPRESIINRLVGYNLIEEKELDAKDLFDKSWDELINLYNDNIKKLHFEFKDPYIVLSEFVNRGGKGRILTLNIKFEAISVFEELYIKRGIIPKGLTHIKCGIGFGGNYSDYVSILNSKLLNNRIGLPKYVLADSLCVPGHGDYLPVIKMYKGIKSWEYYRPAYRESGIDTLYELKEAQKYDLLEILKSVNVSSEDNGNCFIDETRRKNIIGILESNPKVSLLYKDSYVLLYTTGIENKGDIILISCHIDIVFKEDELFLDVNGNNIKGTLDNSATVAAILYSLQEYDFPKNVIISFTGGEEKDFVGAEATRDCLENNFEDLYDRLGMVLTLDISPDNVDKDISVENLNIEGQDFENTNIRFNSIKELKDKIKKILADTGLSYGIIEKGEPDESHFYAEWDLNTVSLCLPCECEDEDPHSLDGCVTTVSKLKKYSEALNIICKNIFKV